MTYPDKQPSVLRHAASALAATATLFSFNVFAEEAPGADPRIGEEVNRICFGRNINGWRTIDGQDNVILLKKSVSRWYRAELIGACDERVLDRALSIGIDSWPAGGCVSRGDIILVEDSPAFTRRCAISRINEWDEDAAAPEEENEESEDYN